tara:strand:+ start:2115 stop:2549 length:435 start_codon:yes stop_codon:yes gene_type:complete
MINIDELINDLNEHAQDCVDAKINDCPSETIYHQAVLAIQKLQTHALSLEQELKISERNNRFLTREKNQLSFYINEIHRLREEIASIENERDKNSSFYGHGVREPHDASLDRQLENKADKLDDELEILLNSTPAEYKPETIEKE